MADNMQDVHMDTESAENQQQPDTLESLRAEIDSLKAQVRQLTSEQARLRASRSRPRPRMNFNRYQQQHRSYFDDLPYMSFTESPIEYALSQMEDGDEKTELMNDPSVKALREINSDPEFQKLFAHADRLVRPPVINMKEIDEMIEELKDAKMSQEYKEKYESVVKLVEKLKSVPNYEELIEISNQKNRHRL